MLDVIEKLLILQDRDRKIIRAKAELGGIGPQRQALLTRAASTQSVMDAAKLRTKQIETDRKKLELEVETNKGKIEKYSIQQFQTKKNDEFKALGNEIETCKRIIIGLDDQQIELMEQMEVAQKELAEASKIANELKKQVDTEIAELDAREQRFKKQLEELQGNRGELAAVVEESALSKYERLLKHKGDNMVVGINHCVCGGCHMKLPTQVVISCRNGDELTSCPHCGRIIYYTHDMELTEVD